MLAARALEVRQAWHGEPMLGARALEMGVLSCILYTLYD